MTEQHGRFGWSEATGVIIEFPFENFALSSIRLPQIGVATNSRPTQNLVGVENETSL